MPAKIRPEKPRYLERKIKEQILTDGFSSGLKGDNKKVPLSLLRRVAELKNSWRSVRDLYEYDLELEKCLLPLVDSLIDTCSRQNVRFLDAGAGKGNLGHDLEKRYPPKKKRFKTVNYHAIDLRESAENEKVRAFDLSVDRLPRNYFDVIVSCFVFPYLGDKLHALESLCNSLRVGGTLTIAHFGEIKINGMVFNLEDSRFIYRFTHYLELCNPHLKINFTGKGGLLIKKIKEGETRVGLHFEGVEVPSENLDSWKWALKNLLDSSSPDMLTTSTYRI